MTGRHAAPARGDDVARKSAPSAIEALAQLGRERNRPSGPRFPSVGALTSRRDVAGDRIDRLDLAAIARAGPGVEERSAAGVRCRRPTQPVPIDDPRPVVGQVELDGARGPASAVSRQAERRPRPAVRRRARRPVRGRDCRASTTGARRPSRRRRHRRPRPSSSPIPARPSAAAKAAGAGSGMPAGRRSARRGRESRST